MASSSIQQISKSILEIYNVALSHPYLAFSLLIAASLLHNKYGHGLASIPGPPLAAWTSFWRLWWVYQGNATSDTIELHRKYGNLVRIAPHVVSVADRAEIPNIYGRGETFKKTAFFPIQSITWKKKPAMNIFSERDPIAHREDKKRISSTYSLNTILQMEDAIDDCSTLFMRKMAEDFASKEKPVDLGVWLQYYAFDVVGELTFARKLGFLESGEDVDGMIGAIQGIIAYSAIIGQMPWLHKLLLGNPLLSLLLPAMENWNQVLVFTLKCINSRASLKKNGDLLNADAGGNDMLSRLAYVKNTDPQKMDTRGIVIHTSANVFAGSDTTAIALRAIIYYLLKTPDEMAKVVAELDAADRAGKLSHPTISYKESTEHLPYLCAAIKEALRLHPSIGLIMERHVPPEGATICGKRIPGGTIVGINSWVSSNSFRLSHLFLPILRTPLSHPRPH